MTTLKELAAKHADWAASYYRKPSGRPSREAVNLATAIGHAVSYSPAQPAGSVSPAWLTAVRQTMVDRGLARSTINARVRRIRRVFKWGVRQELVPASALMALQSVDALKRGRSPAREAAAIEPVGEDLVRRTALHAAEPVRSMIWLLWWTGMRPGELVQIRPADIEQRAEGWLYRPREHKTEHHGQQRVIALGPRARDWVEPWMTPSGQDAFLFPTRSRRRSSSGSTRTPPMSAARRATPSTT